MLAGHTGGEVSVFDKIATALFWKRKYRDFWRRNGIRFGGVSDSLFGPLSINVELLKWDRRLDEKLAYWEQHGKLRGYTPEQAAFNAMQEACNEFYEKFKLEPDMENTWREIGQKLGFIASVYLTDPGMEGEKTLSDQWIKYYGQVTREWELARQRGEEIRSYRFGRAEIQCAWSDLLAGTAPPEAKRIWSALPRVIESAHVISKRADVTPKEFVFWMAVLRDHGLLTEYPHTEPKFLKARMDTYGVDQQAAVNASSFEAADKAKQGQTTS